MPPLTPAQIACLIVVAIASVTDLRSAKIRNWLTFPAVALGIVLQYLQTGNNGALAAVEGCFLGIAIMLSTRLFGWHFGMGDVKLFAAIGSFLGPTTIIISFFYFFLSFAPVAWYRIIAALPWKQLVHAIPSFLRDRNLLHLAGLDWSRFSTARKSALLFGPFIAIGAALAIFFEPQTWEFLGFK